MLRLIILLGLILNLTFAQEVNSSTITLDWLEDKPRTITKDFYIYQYLQQDISSKEASIALGQAKNVNDKLFIAYAKKFNDPDTLKVAQCLQKPLDQLLDEDIDCIEVGFSVYKATQLEIEQREQLINKLKDSNQVLIDTLKVMNAYLPFTKLIASDKDVFFKLFNGCGSRYREDYLNYTLPQRTLDKLKEDRRFEAMINRIVVNRNLSNIQRSLLGINPKDYSHQTTFYLALNALMHKKHQLALDYLENAYDKAYYSFDKNKVRFWQYKISKEDKYLDDLLSSTDNNIYSLLIQEEHNTPQENIFYTIEQKNDQTNAYDINDPFLYVNLIRDSKSLDTTKYLTYQELFTTNETLPQLTYVTTIYEKYKNSYFITPYEDTYFKDYDPKIKALMYAIARQESRFIPTSISSAYALGVMQIMPFLGKEIAKNLDIEFQTIDLLDIETNLQFAHYHINDLKSRLEHPLLIAYAYNAGEGFVNRQLLKKDYFKSDSYEPFLSMELIPYSETKKYGKKVLANYYIYYNYLNEEKIKLSTLLEMLLLPHQG